MKLYRGLTKDGKMVYGWYCHIGIDHYIIFDNAVIEDPLSTFEAISGFIKVVPATVAQQVGRQDKNKEEIYGGDKLRFGKRILTVVWDEETLQWRAGEEDNPYFMPLCECATECFEIIPPEVKEKSK